jgi:CPA2 family monovalent cation:H+ antiporter-2
MFRYPTRTALTIAASLAQIGEFSFILATLAVSLKLLPPEGQSLVVAGAIFSITLNPLAFWLADRAAHWFEAPAPPPTAETAALHDHAVIVGYSRVGSAIGETFVSGHVPFVVIELDDDRVDALLSEGVPVVHGDGTRHEVLSQAGVERARLLVIAVSDPYQAAAIAKHAHELNAAISMIARANSDEERSYLEEHGVELVLSSKTELALAMAYNSLLRMGSANTEADAVIDSLRHARPAAVH